MITNDYGRGEGGKNCQKIDYVICEQPLSSTSSHRSETAINIGYSCKLIKPRMEVLILEGDESDEVKFEIKELQYRIDELRRAAKKVTFYTFVRYFVR